MGSVFFSLKNRNDFRYMQSSNPESRRDFWTSCCQIFKYLANAGYFPKFTVLGRITKERKRNRTPTMAELAFKFGKRREDIGVSWVDRDKHVLKLNEQMLKALRRALVCRFEAEYDLFRLGKQYYQQHHSRLGEIEASLSWRNPDVAEYASEASLSIAIAIAFLWAMDYADYRPITLLKVNLFIRAVGERRELRAYLGATPAALCAAFHIVLIDTFAEDIHAIEPARAFLQPLIDKVWSYSVANGIRAKTVTLKVKYSDFNQITRSKTIGAPIADVRELVSLVDVLLDPVFPTDKGIRLLGVTLSSLERPSEALEPQLLLSLD